MLDINTKDYGFDFEAVITTVQWQLKDDLKLTHNCINSHGVALLCKLDLRYLRRLNLSYNNIGYEGVAVIAGLECKYLKRFDISENPIGNKGIKALCSANWPNLTYLQI